MAPGSLWRQLQCHARRADDVVGLSRRSEVFETKTCVVIFILIAGQLGPEGKGEIFAPRAPAGLRRGDVADIAFLPVGQPVVNAEIAGCDLQIFVQPDPAARTFIDPARRRHRVHHPEPLARVVFDAGLDPFQPAVPPPKRLLQKADARFGPGVMRILVDPGADDGLRRTVEIAHQSRGRVAIPVMPAANRQNGNINRAEILADRPVFPIGIPPLMAEPCVQQKGLRPQPLQPHLAPAFAHDLRIGRAGRIGQHLRRPAEVLAQHRAALVVNIVSIAVHRRAQRDDRLQSFWSQRRQLQPVEPAP